MAVQVGSKTWVRHPADVVAVQPDSRWARTEVLLEDGRRVISDWLPSQVADALAGDGDDGDPDDGRRLIDMDDPEEFAPPDLDPADDCGCVRTLRVLSDRVVEVKGTVPEYEIRVTEAELMALNRLIIDTGSDADDIRALGTPLWPLYEQLADAARAAGLRDRIFALPGYDVGKPRVLDS